MKLYEFNFRKGKLKVYEYEVKETPKQYTVLQGRIEYNCLSRIPKDLVGKVLNSNYWGVSYLSTEKNVEVVKEKFIEYWKNIVIPNYEFALKNAEENLTTAKLDLEIFDKWE